MELNTPQVRDLAWVIQSPVLLSKVGWNSQPAGGRGDQVVDDGLCQQQYAKHKLWLSALDTTPRPLLEWLGARQNPRLGYYFESLVEYWLRRENPANRLVSHLQVNESGDGDHHRTLGEFDFLLEDAQHQHIQHWEVAVKFYLQYHQKDGRYVWYGPNPRDRLDLKLQRMFRHQLTLSRLPAASATLQRMKLTLPVRPRLFLKGYLFYRSDTDWLVAQSHHGGLSDNHLRGWWTFLEPFQIPNAASQHRWLYLPRLRWLSPAQITDVEENALMDFQELHGFCFDLINRHQKPPLLAEMRLSDSGVWEEVSRGFVVPQQWPGITEKP